MLKTIKIKKINWKDFLNRGGILFFLILSSCNKDDLKWNLKKAPEVSQISLITNDLEKIDLSANCLSDGNDKNTEMGFCWSTSVNPTIENNQIPNSHKGKGLFKASINWTNSSTIHIRAYVKNSIATVYSNDLSVTWSGSSINKPTVQTISVSNVSFYSFQTTGNISSDGGLNVFSRGVCISTSPNPNLTNANQIQYFNGSNNPFSIDFIGLQDNTIYYFAAFATNLAGTSYGNVITTFTPKHYNIGDLGPSGGYIIYQNPGIYESWNFLEAAPIDIAGNYSWSPNLNQSNITGLNILDGYNNTFDLVSFYGLTQNYAARATYDWIYSSANEWYLPSLNELKLIKELLFDQGIGNLSNNGTYWSSSEDANYSQNAWTVKMSTTVENHIITQTKNIPFLVRAIRRI